MKSIFYFIFIFFLTYISYSQTPDKYLGWDGWEGDYKNINYLTYSKDGKTLISGGDEQKIRFWNSTDGKLIKTVSGYNIRIWSIDISPDGTKMIFSGVGNQIVLWDLSKDTLINLLSGHTGNINGLKFFNDGLNIASASNDANIKIWDIQDLKSIKVLKTIVAGAPGGFEITPDNTKILVRMGAPITGNNSILRLFDINSMFQLKDYYNYGTSTTSVKITKDGKTGITSHGDFTIKYWDCDNWYSGALLKTINTGHKGSITNLAISPGGTKLASSSEDGTIKIWDISSGILLKTILFDIGNPISICFSPDGSKIASGGYGYKNIRIFDLGLADVKDNRLEISNYSLSQNYPNPFNPETIIKYSVPKSGIVTIKIFDILGRYIETLVNEEHRVGEYSINWKPQNLTSGVYYYELHSNNQVKIKKMIYTK